MPQDFWTSCGYHLLRRNDEGRLKLRRVYGFEYSDTGHNRRKGSITMLGDAVLALYIGLRVAPGDTPRLS